MGSLNARKPNLNDGDENTPLLSNVYYKRPDGARVMHMMNNESGVQKGICTIITERRLWVPGMNELYTLKSLFQQDYLNPEKSSLILD